MYNEDHPLWQLDQLISGYLQEDWMSDYTDPWAAAEDYVVHTSPAYLELALVGVRHLLRQVPDADQRYGCLPGVRDGFVGGEFDRWLTDVERRIEQRLVGDDSEPLVAAV